jgi:hypothetical protein
MPAEPLSNGHPAARRTKCFCHDRRSEMAKVITIDSQRSIDRSVDHARKLFMPMPKERRFAFAQHATSVMTATAVIPVLALGIATAVAQAPAQSPAKSAPAKSSPAKSAPANAAKPAPAQQNEAAPAQQQQPPQFKEVALTDKHVEGVLDSQKELDEIAAKIPQPKPNEPPKPDPAIQAQFESVAKKHGFADYAEYNGAVETISVVMGGFDPKTKTYVGPEAVMKQQIAALQADKKVPAKEKKAALDEMNAMLKSPPPPIQNKGNIDLVGKYYDRLTALLQDNQ